MTERGALWEHRVRGLVVGLALGDSMGGALGHLRDTGAVQAGVSTQLAAFTIEGAIRAQMRGLHRGICHPPSVVWHAYQRWAYLQGLADDMPARWDSGQEWPDGWLSRVPLMGERRGSAPATVAAVVQFDQGTVDKPTTSSAGAHALTRSLPLAAFSSLDPGHTVGFARDVAALTHGGADAHAAASFGVTIAGQALSAPTLAEALGAAFLIDDVDLGSGLVIAVEGAKNAAARPPRDEEELRTLAPDATALAALRGGLYVSLSFPEPDQVMDALRFARRAPHPSSVAAVAGAFLGAVHGIDAWPVSVVSRLELAWVLDTLARDMVLQLRDNPGGDEYTAARDPNWWRRYPGW